MADGLNFEVAGTSVLVVDNPQDTPSRWRFRVGDVPDTSDSVNWFTSMALVNGKDVATSADELVYIMGNVGTRGIGAFEKGSKNVLGRIKLSSLIDLRLDDIAALVGRENSGGTWARHSDPSSRLAIMSPASAEMSLQYHPALKRWYSLEVDSVTAQLVLWTAERPWGDWESTVIYNIPPPYDDLTKYRCYAGKGHPEMSREEGIMVELAFSYVCNAAQDTSLLFQEDHLDLYTPQFVRVLLHKPPATTTGVMEEWRP